jgi:PAS domain S-box-containing protein
LIIEGRLIGVVAMFARRPLSEVTLRALKAVANGIALGILRKQSEEELRKGEERFRTLADNMSQLAWMADEKGQIFWYNQRWFDYTGTTLEEMQGAGWKMVHHPDHLERVVTGLQHSWKTGEPWEDTFPLRSKDGQYQWFLSRALPIRDAGGQIIRWFGTNTDIDELLRTREELRLARDELEQRVKERTRELAAANAGLEEEVRQRLQTEKELQILNQELERSNRELQDFAFVASHDLQEPLRKIQAFGDLLKTEFGAALGSEGSDFVERMQNASQRMHTLINDLLTFSRVTTKGQPFTTVDLKDVAREVVNDLEARIKQTGGRVEIGELPKIEADPLQMRQLLQNLMANALKFHRPGEAPLVRLESNCSPDNQSVNGQQENPPGLANGFCQITVADNGIGFDEKYLDRIFTPFQRLHSRGEYEGTGMGLAVCRKIVERHGGAITARSEVGQGSTFLITLPMTHIEGADKV